jgi:hypothetical protein
MPSIELGPDDSRSGDLPAYQGKVSSAGCDGESDDAGRGIENWWDAPVPNRLTAAYQIGRYFNQLDWHLQHSLFFVSPIDMKMVDEVLDRLVAITRNPVVNYPDHIAVVIPQYRDIWKDWVLCEAAGEEAGACYDDDQLRRYDQNSRACRRELVDGRVQSPLRERRDRIFKELPQEERWAFDLGRRLDEGLRRSDVHRFFDVEFSVQEDPSPVEKDYWCGVYLDGRKIVRSFIPGELEPDETWSSDLKQLLARSNVPIVASDAILQLWKHEGMQSRISGLPRAIEQLDRIIREHLAVLQANNEGASDPISFDDIRLLAGVSKKRVQNCVGEWRKGDVIIPDPCSYAIVRPFIVNEWPLKAIMFPEKYDALLEMLARKKADLAGEK